MKLLQINWEDAGVLVVLDVKSDEDVSQETLESVDANVLDLIKVETDRTGITQFRRALIDTEEDEENDKTKYSIADWELIS